MLLNVIDVKCHSIKGRTIETVYMYGSTLIM